MVQTLLGREHPGGDQKCVIISRGYRSGKKPMDQAAYAETFLYKKSFAGAQVMLVVVSLARFIYRV